MRKNLYRFLAAGVILVAVAGMAGCSEKKDETVSTAAASEAETQEND